MATRIVRLDGAGGAYTSVSSATTLDGGLSNGDTISIQEAGDYLNEVFDITAKTNITIQNDSGGVVNLHTVPNRADYAFKIGNGFVLSDVNIIFEASAAWNLGFRAVGITTVFNNVTFIHTVAVTNNFYFRTNGANITLNNCSSSGLLTSFAVFLDTANSTYTLNDCSFLYNSSALHYLYPGNTFNVNRSIAYSRFVIWNKYACPNGSN